RNLYRGKADAFASDAKAREVARHAIAKGFDLEVPVESRKFFYIPFEHSEDMADQDLCVRLGAERIGRAPAPDSMYAYGCMHRGVVPRFGRFHGRSAALGRESTPEERGYLAGP